MLINRGYILFWSGMLSNWARAPYEWKGLHFDNSEQHYMYLKAKHFGDEETASKILTETSPKVVKALGRRVAGYDDANWELHREDAMYEACYAKFSGNKKAHDFMMSLPRGRYFAEASPYDTIWGIGWEEHHPNAAVPGAWRGRNLLGNVLNRVRATLLNEKPKTLFE